MDTPPIFLPSFLKKTITGPSQHRGKLISDNTTKMDMALLPSSSSRSPGTTQRLSFARTETDIVEKKVECFPVYESEKGMEFPYVNTENINVYAYILSTDTYTHDKLIGVGFIYGAFKC